MRQPASSASTAVARSGRDASAARTGRRRAGRRAATPGSGRPRARASSSTRPSRRPGSAAIVTRRRYRARRGRARSPSFSSRVAIARRPRSNTAWSSCSCQPEFTAVPSASSSNASCSGSVSGAELAALDRRAGVAGQQLGPARHLRRDGVAHRARAAVHLDRRVGEEAAAGERAALHVVEPAVEHAAQAGDAGLVALLGVADHAVDEDRRGGAHGRDLQLLLRAEVGEQPALAHLELGRQAADRQALEALDGGDVDGGGEDRAARAVAADLAAVPRVRGVRRRLSEKPSRKR